MNARVVRTIINGEVKWRVYQDQEPVALFELESLAHLFVAYLNKKENKKENEN